MYRLKQPPSGNMRGSLYLSRMRSLKRINLVWVTDIGYGWKDPESFLLT